MVLPLVGCLEAEVLAVSSAAVASPDLEAMVGKEDWAATVVMVALVHVWCTCCAAYVQGACCEDTCNTD